MSNLKVLEETPISAVELKEKLNKVKKRDKELGKKATKTVEYLNTFTNLKIKEAEDIKKKIINLNIPRLRDRHIVKVLDIMPKEIDSLKMLFSGENITIKEEDLNKVLEVIKKNKMLSQNDKTTCKRRTRDYTGFPSTWVSIRHKTYAQEDGHSSGYR
ncbi:MAG: hypothetical protein L6408_00820 [Nanoarchaeota archaeon]|nr:hypothetical protein [Nanoarchaeota archaeon]